MAVLHCREEALALGYHPVRMHTDQDHNHNNTLTAHKSGSTWTNYTAHTLKPNNPQFLFLVVFCKLGLHPAIPRDPHRLNPGNPPLLHTQALLLLFPPYNSAP